MDWDEEFSERELWLRCLPGWVVTAFLAPFADEVGLLRARTAWIIRCVALALFVVALLPPDLLDAFAGGAARGALFVLVVAALHASRVP